MAVYACSDFHGMLHMYKAIKEFLQPEDKVYFLGDAGDRGPKPWETIKSVLTDSQFIYIKGNHEDMLAEALCDFIDRGCPAYSSHHLLSMNGGETTFSEAIAEFDVEGWYRKLVKLDLIQEYVNEKGERIILSHAGFTPWKKDSDTEYRRPHYDDLIWDRDHFLDEWKPEDCVDCYIIHGHTPITSLLDEIDPACKMGEIEPGALWYADGRKCCVDCGAVFTGYCVLLNLDTWDEEVFYSEPYL